jgi:hypothetical protein
LEKKVLKLESLDQVGVPNVSTVGDADVLPHLGNVMELGAAFLKEILATEDGSMALHSLLHSDSNLSGRLLALGVSDSIELGNSFLTGTLGKFGLSLAWFVLLGSGVGSTTSENDEIKEWVSTKSVSTVHWSASNLTGSEETWDNLVLAISSESDDLSLPVGWDTTHVVMDSGDDWDGFLSHINTSENVSSLRNTRESFLEGVGRQVVQVKVDVITLGTNTSALNDFHGHGSWDDVTRGEILGIRGITLHKALTVLITKDTTLTTAALSHEATGTIDASRVELNELGVLKRKASADSHSTTITSASVGGCAGLVSTSVSTSGENSLVGSHSVDGSISHVIGHNTAADTVIHYEVKSEVLNEEYAVVAESATEQGVKHTVTCAISDGAAAVSLAASSEVLWLTTEGTLIDLSILGTREGHTIRLELKDSSGGLLGHVVNCILVTKPIGSLDCVIEMPSPVVLVHVTESSIDTTLMNKYIIFRILKSSWMNLCSCIWDLRF